MKEKAFLTAKMDVIIYDDFVLKTFKKSFGYKKRYLTEKKVLDLLYSIEGIPKILSFSNEIPRLKITRLNGNNVTHFSDRALLNLKSKLYTILKLGVAIHSLPIRDILVDENDIIGIVDFERATIKEESWKITWHIAYLVSKFHICKFIFKQNHNLLTINELKFVNRGLFLRRIFKKYMKIRNVIRDFYRNKFNLKPD